MIDLVEILAYIELRYLGVVLLFLVLYLGIGLRFLFIAPFDVSPLLSAVISLPTTAVIAWRYRSTVF